MGCIIACDLSWGKKETHAKAAKKSSSSYYRELANA
jgi:hypothetical protein